MATIFWLRPLEAIAIPLSTIFVPLAAEALLNSHKTQHFSVSHLISYEILLLTIPHRTLSCCNNLNLASSPLCYPENWWFLSKMWQCEYCTSHAISIHFDVTEMAPLPLPTAAREVELYGLILLDTGLHPIQGQNWQHVYIDSTYAFRVAYDLGILWKRRGFLTSIRNKTQIGQYVQELLDIIILPTALAIIKIPRHSLETKGNHLTDTNARNAIL